jgi:hypothetical protein
VTRAPSARERWASLALALLICSMAIPGAAGAQTRDRGARLASPRRPLDHDPSQFALDLMAGTTLPIAVGGSAALEVPGHVVIRVSAGAVPSAYVDAINDVGTGAGAWQEDDALVASTLLSGATFLELGLGIRPWGTPGLGLSLGYALLWSHRPVGMGLVGASGDRLLGLDLSIHAVHAEVAWQTELVDHLYLRVALGWAHAFSQRVSLTTSMPDEAMTAMLSEAESALAATVGRYAFGPTLAIALGARF